MRGYHVLVMQHLAAALLCACRRLQSSTMKLLLALTALVAVAAAANAQVLVSLAPQMHTQQLPAHMAGPAWQ